MRFSCAGSAQVGFAQQILRMSCDSGHALASETVPTAMDANGRFRMLDNSPYTPSSSAKRSPMR